MWISWTLGLQSIAQTGTNKRVFRVLQPYQLSMSQFQISSIIMLLAHEMWKRQWNLQHGPTTFSQNRFVNSV